MESDLIYMILLIFASILLIILMYNFKRKQGSTLRTKEQTLLYTTYKSFIDNLLKIKLIKSGSNRIS